MCPICKSGDLLLIMEFSGWKKWQLRKSSMSNLDPTQNHGEQENGDKKNLLSANDYRDLKDEEYIDVVYCVECEYCGRKFNHNLTIRDTGFEVEVIEPFKPEDESEMMKRVLMY